MAKKRKFSERIEVSMSSKEIEGGLVVVILIKEKED